MAVKAGTAYIDVQGDFSSLNKQIDAALGPISGKFGKLGKAGAVGLAGVGLAAVSAGKALYDIGGQFDDAYDKIRVGTGKTGKALKGLEGDFKSVVKSVPTDFDSASTAVSQLNSRLGVTGKPLRALSGQVLELSRITKTDLSTNIESVTRLFGDWGISTKHQAGALDKLFRASQATNVPVSKLSDLMVKFGGPLRQLGFGFDQAAALAGKFQKEGVNTELVMGSLRIALGRMAKEGVKDPQEALQKLTAQIKNAGSAGEANKLALETFGARAGPDMAAAIREGRFEIGDLQKTIAGGKDTIIGAGKDTQDFSEKWTLLKNRVLVGLEPLATRVFGAVGAAMDALPGIVDNVRGAFDRLTGVFSGGGEGGGFAAKAATSFGQLKDALVTSFQTIITVGTFLWDTFGATIVDHLKDTVKMVAGVLQGVITAFKGIVDIISGVLSGDWGKAWDGVKELFSGAWQAMTSIVTGTWENIKTIVSLGVTAIGTTIKAAATALLDLGKWIVNRIVDGLKVYAQLWIDVAGWIKNRLVDGIRGFAGAFTDAGSWVTNRLAEGTRTVTGLLGSVGGWLKNRVVEFVQNEITGFQAVGSWITNRVADGIRVVTDALSGVGGWLKNRLLDGVSAVKDGFLGIGGKVIGWIVDGLKAGVNQLVGFLNLIVRLLNKIPGVDISPIAKVSSIDTGDTGDATPVLGLAQGGALHRGQKLTRPVVMMGEEAPAHPEYVIPTNPAYRGRALGLFQRLGQELGVRAFAQGGVIQDLARKVWGAETDLMGSHGAMPALVFAKLAGDQYAHFGAESGKVTIDTGMLAALRNPGSRNHDYALSALVHEFAHARQRADVIFGDKRLREGGAEQFSLWADNQIYGQLGIPFKNAEDGYPAYTAFVRSHKKPAWWQHGQFSPDSTGATASAAGVVDTITSIPGDILDAVSGIIGPLPGVGDLPDWLKGTGKYVLGKVAAFVKSKASSILGGGGEPGGPSGLGSFDGLPVAKWIVPILAWAREHGWGGHITSGYRSHAHNVAQGRNYYSNHEGVQYPGGAIDVGGYGARAEGAALAAVLGHYTGSRRLVWGGPVINDWGHFSATGHRKGGLVGQGIAPFVGSYKDGGVVPRDGLAYVHQGETITPASALQGCTFQLVMGGQVIDERIELRIIESDRRKGAAMRAGVL